MNTNLLTKSLSLDDLIRTGREKLDKEKELENIWVEEQAEEARLKQEARLQLVLEQLPEAIRPFTELGDLVRYHEYPLFIQLPDCDRIRSDWKIDMEQGQAERVGSFELRKYSPDFWDGYPRSENEEFYGDLAMALAAAIEQGPTYKKAEQALAEREAERSAKPRETTLQEALTAALEIGDENSRGALPDWRLMAVIAQSLVSIAESQVARVNQANGY